MGLASDTVAAGLIWSSFEQPYRPECEECQKTGKTRLESSCLRWLFKALATLQTRLRLSVQSRYGRHDRCYGNVLSITELVQQAVVRRDRRLVYLSQAAVGTIAMKVSKRGVREVVTGGNLSQDSSMDFAELAFAYSPADRLLLYCRWTQNTGFSAQCLMVCSVWRALLTLNVLLNKLDTHALTRRKQRVPNRVYVLPVGCSDDMQAIQGRQLVEPHDRHTQGCPTLTLKRGCICQYWFIRLPLWSEGAT